MPKKNRKTKRICRYVFTDEELQAIGKSLADSNNELAALKQEKKRFTADFGAKIQASEGQISIAAHKIQSGYESREIECTVTMDDPKKGKKSIRRDDTHELVATEDMTAEELQDELPME